MKYPKTRLSINKIVSTIAFKEMMKYSENRWFCGLMADRIADEVVGIIHNNYRRRS